MFVVLAGETESHSTARCALGAVDTSLVCGSIYVPFVSFQSFVLVSHVCHVARYYEPVSRVCHSD